MLNEKEKAYIYRHAYVPEHLPDYVESVSDSKAVLENDFLYYVRRNHLTFIAYPLKKEDSRPGPSFESACRRFRPATTAVIAESLWFSSEDLEDESKDYYYRLNLPVGRMAPAVSNMVRRAQQVLKVSRGRFGREHKKLIKGFISNRKLSDAHRRIFKRIPRYVKESPYAAVLDARTLVKGRLAAFNILDLGSADHAFYLFNFRSEKTTVPGASDLLFMEMTALAESEGKVAINLGLGIHAGIRRFKEKWGGRPYLKYKTAVIRQRLPALGSLVNKL